MNPNKILTYISFTVCLFLLFAFSGCRKELDFEYRDIEPLFVIEGALTQYGCEVFLSYTVPMDEPITGKYVTDAEVAVLDIEDGSEVRLETADGKGFVSSVPGIAGHEYRLRVSHGGNVYEAETVMMPAVGMESVEFGWIKMPYDHVAVLKAVFHDDATSQGDCYWVRLYRNGEAYKWSIMTDDSAKDGLITATFMTTRQDIDKEDDDDLLLDGDIVTVKVCAVSRGMYDYLEAISSDSNGPAMFTGERCLGYFLASPVSESSIEFHPSLIE